MLETRISLASPLLALRGGWEAGIMNNHTPIMDTTTNPTSFLLEREQELTCQIVMTRVTNKMMMDKQNKILQVKTGLALYS